MILCGTAVQQLEELSEYCVLKRLSAADSENLAGENSVKVIENSLAQNFQENLGSRMFRRTQNVMRLRSQSAR